MICNAPNETTKIADTVRFRGTNTSDATLHCNPAVVAPCLPACVCVCVSAGLTLPRICVLSSPPSRPSCTSSCLSKIEMSGRKVVSSQRLRASRHCAWVVSGPAKEFCPRPRASWKKNQPKPDQPNPDHETHLPFFEEGGFTSPGLSHQLSGNFLESSVGKKEGVRNVCFARFGGFIDENVSLSDAR